IRDRNVTGVQTCALPISIIANNRGLNDAAAVGIVEKVISFVFLVPSSMLSTVSALAAQNAGAGKDERAVQTLRYAVILCLGFGRSEERRVGKEWSSRVRA